MSDTLWRHLISLSHEHYSMCQNYYFSGSSEDHFGFQDSNQLIYNIFSRLEPSVLKPFKLRTNLFLKKRHIILCKVQNKPRLNNRNGINILLLTGTGGEFHTKVLHSLIIVDIHTLGKTIFARPRLSSWPHFNQHTYIHIIQTLPVTQPHTKLTSNISPYLHLDLTLSNLAPLDRP